VPLGRLRARPIPPSAAIGSGGGIGTRRPVLSLDCVAYGSPGRYAEGLAYLRRAAELNQDSPVAHYNLAVGLHRRREGLFGGPSYVASQGGCLGREGRVGDSLRRRGHDLGGRPSGHLRRGRTERLKATAARLRRHKCPPQARGRLPKGAFLSAPRQGPDLDFLRRAKGLAEVRTACSRVPQNRRNESPSPGGCCTV
jgi:hypothetical protein